MIKEVTRSVSTWGEAAYVLGKNDQVLGKNLIELTARVVDLEKRVKKLRKLTCVACVVAGVGLAAETLRTDNVCDRLEKCEQQLREKENVVYHSMYRK